jgi:hypothetical protein
LTCDRCGCESDVDTRAPGWRVYIVLARVLTYCPACAARRRERISLLREEVHAP